MQESRIKVLSENAINQIAAGEVIENPASVIKELIENAIDAGASEIFVTTTAGGRGLIKIEDDGHGMGHDDLLLSIERHATSKIGSVEELNDLRTLGFRGEALPSIASVSKMSLHSALEGSSGYKLQIEGGKISAIQLSPRQKGTTIEVKSLFYNVPVRKKFQKSVSYDVGEIHKLLTRFSLCYPLLSFKWVNDEKEWLDFGRADPFDKRALTLLGQEFLDNSFPVEQSNGHLEIKGRISSPLCHRPNKLGQHLFINSRAVLSPFVAGKVLEAYGTRLDTHRYPLFALHLKVPPSWIDVNVHPQKKEIRICEEEKLARFILEALEKALEPPKKEIPPQPVISFLPAFERIAFEEMPVITQRVEQETPLDFFASRVSIAARIKNYFLIQEAEGLRVVDIGRAAERVIFDEMTNAHKKVSVQALLIPIQLSFSGKEKLYLAEKLPELNTKGISIREFGGDTFIIDAIPSILEPSEIPDLIHAFLEEGQFPRQLGKCLKRGAISNAMASALIEKLFKSQNPDLTPSGKKIHYLLDEKALEKLL